ncbi:MAG: signal peptide peptidase SppA [Bacteroidia bacterium]|jgi:protease-4|nr:signal peptide peptidase SppA [Bacteroidia bacterium]GIV23783.1 MAG: signal peptide peptidase SppA [Bacteroidia bacterium]
MWRFLRLVLAFILAFFLTILIGGALIAGMLTTGLTIAGSREADTKPLPKKGWLKIAFSGELREHAAADQPSFSWIEGLFGGPSEEAPTLEELRVALQEAATNEKVQGIILEMGDLSAQPAQIQQIGRWLAAFKAQSKKPIYAYGDYFTESTYYLASLADTIVMYPQAGASLEWNGLATQALFFRRFLEKWGVKPRLFRVGRYKSAAESFTEEKYSEDNRAQLAALLEDIWAVWVDSIARRRHLSPESLRVWPDQYVFFSAEQAQAKGLIDLRMPWQEWMGRFIPEGEEKPAFISVRQLLHAAKKKGSEEQVALVYAEGEIGPESALSAEELVPVIEKLAREEKVKAVVLRVHSPGGAVLDSDKIARALRALREKKPLVVSMGGVAASGGYYISAFAQKIVAEPTTVTGSIGVIGLLFDVRELLEKHVELRSDRVKVGGKYADFMSPYREALPEEVARLQGEIESIYQEFLAVVQEGRRYPSREAVHTIAQGRVWSGTDALPIGLVDTLGGIETAIVLAARAAALEEYSVGVYPKPQTFWERWLKEFNAVAHSMIAVLLKPANFPDSIQLRWADEVKIY